MMALNGLLCADVPLRNCSLTRLHNVLEISDDGDDDKAGSAAHYISCCSLYSLVIGLHRVAVKQWL